MGETIPGELFVFGARHAVVAVGVDGDTAARQNLSPNLDILRLHQLYQILHNDVHAVLVEISMIVPAEMPHYVR